MAKDKITKPVSIKYKDITINPSWTGLGLNISSAAIMSIGAVYSVMMESYTLTAYNGEWQAHTGSNAVASRVYYVEV